MGFSGSDPRIQMDNPVRTNIKICTQLENVTLGCEIEILNGSWSNSEREDLVSTKKGSVTTESQPYKNSSK